MTSLRASTLALLLLAVACQDVAPSPDQSVAQHQGPRDEATRASLIEVLRDLPVQGDLGFDEYLTQVRAVLVAGDDDELRRIAGSIPDDPRAIPDATYREALPALLAGYARGRLRDARILALSSLIQHETTNAVDAAAPGRGPAFDAFEHDLATRAGSLGLRFDHVDHIAYEITSPRDTPHEIGILVHADVVPASEPGWTVPPFAGVVREGKLYGRGAIDDKGPLVAALFAVAALEKSGVPFIRRFRLVAGTSEETHWAGIERYQALRPMPPDTLVADATFPVGVGEKGIATLRVTARGDGAVAATSTSGVTLLGLEGGLVANQVPAEARAILGLPDGGNFIALLDGVKKDKDHLRAVVRQDGAVVVEARGRAAHSAEPEKGDNAIARLVRFLVADGQLAPSSCATLLTVLDRRLGLSPDGKGLGVPDAHPRFGGTTVNLGRLTRRDDGGCEAHLNVRWPPPRTADEIKAAITSTLHAEALALAPGTTFVVEGGGLDPFLIEDESPLVQALLASYEGVTGRPGRTITVAGTTYAKAVKGAVTFGPSPEDDPEGRLHGPNEYIHLAELDALVEMYAFALARLAL